jgi:hypothetical protein
MQPNEAPVAEFGSNSMCRTQRDAVPASGLGDRGRMILENALVRFGHPVSAKHPRRDTRCVDSTWTK